ncbi:hypothetical protein OG211_00110 [Streptomyces niveus]|uniref:PLAT domain-containing protein n=1 Tax=Streptomyces niveus TaxID=193462 RepID=A0ABZ2AI59_STRNV|nr:hypothetical protein [Streptomyces niveus]WTA56987.1 hypothetical protein OG211_00110 [Streptomyces niveus]
MSPIADEIQGFLPLRISDVDADDDGISIEGDRWRLRINTKWRLSGGEGGLEGLVGDDVVETSLQSGPVGFDLSFTTHGGRTLRILSNFPYGEWIFSVWLPGDQQRIPVFDIEGPLQPTEKLDRQRGHADGH